MIYEENNSLNLAKQKIMKIMKIKYSNSVEIEHKINENVDSEMQQINNNINKAKLLLFQMYMSQKQKDNRGHISIMYRGVSQYLLFGSNLETIRNGMNNITEIILRIIDNNDLQFIHPETIQKFYKEADEFEELYMKIASIVTDATGNLKIIDSNGKKDTPDNILLIQKWKELEKSLTDFIKIYKNIENNYNYNGDSKKINIYKNINNNNNKKLLEEDE